MTWTPELVKEALHGAARALQGLPSDRPREHKAQWPEVPQDLWELFSGMSEAEARERQADINAEKTRTRPTPEQISEADVIIRAVYRLPVRNRRMVWARAMGKSLRAISRVDGRSHEWIRQHLDRQYEVLSRHLNLN